MRFSATASPRLPRPSRPSDMRSPTAPAFVLVRNIASVWCAQVAFPEAEVVQRRKIRTGETCGYGATWTAQDDTEAAIVNIGYADGYLRCFAGKGAASANGKVLPLIGRVSMDLIALDVSAAPDLAEGD